MVYDCISTAQLTFTAYTLTTLSLLRRILAFTLPLTKNANQMYMKKYRCGKLFANHDFFIRIGRAGCHFDVI